MIVLLYLHLCAFWVLHGMDNAGYFSQKGPKAYRWDVHRLFVGERALFTSAFAWALVPMDWPEWGGGIAAGILAFPLFHNGAYYQARHQIDQAYSGWRDMSTDSTAKTNFTLRQRVILFMGSILVLTGVSIWQVLAQQTAGA